MELSFEFSFDNKEFPFEVFERMGSPDECSNCQCKL